MPRIIAHQIIRILGVLCYVTAILYLISVFFPSNVLIFTYSIIGIILLCCAFIFISNVSRLIVFILLLMGSFCLYMEGVSISTVIIGFGENANLLTLFLLIPLVGTFMSNAGYLSALKERVQVHERKGTQHPYRLSFLLTATIGILLNFGSIAIVKRIAEESFSSFNDKKITLNIMRAIGICMLWSPYFVNVGLVLVLFNLTWSDIGKYGIILAGIYLIICWVMFRDISFPNDPIIGKNKRKDSYVNQQQSLVPFITFSIVLISLSFLLEYILQVNMLTVISLLALLLPFIWAVLSKIAKVYVSDVFEIVQHSFIRMKNELAVFISAGFFGKALSQTEIGTLISSFLFEVSFSSVYLLSIAIVFLSIILAQIGIHPVIIVTGIGSALSPIKFGVSSEYMALILLVAWATSTQMSPFSAQVLLTSQLINQRPVVITKQNLKFASFSAGILTTVVYSLFLLGWL